MARRSGVAGCRIRFDPRGANGFVFRGGSGRVFLRFGAGNGFVWQIRPLAHQAFELLHRTAVVALGLGLVAEGQGPTRGHLDLAQETVGQGVVAVLFAGGFDVAVEHGGGHGEQGEAAGVEGLVEATGEEAGFQAGGAEHGLLGQGHTFQGEEFLGVDGLVEGDEVGAEMVERLEVFEADDGEGGAGEAVPAGVL